MHQIMTYSTWNLFSPLSTNRWYLGNFEISWIVFGNSTPYKSELPLILAWFPNYHLSFTLRQALPEPKRPVRMLLVK
jgi:hypothetical protein